MDNSHPLTRLLKSLHLGEVVEVIQFLYTLFTINLLNVKKLICALFVLDIDYICSIN